jgi:hypothetical protein
MEESQTLHGREEYRLYCFYLRRSHHRPIKLNVVRDDFIQSAAVKIQTIFTTYSIFIYLLIFLMPLQSYRDDTIILTIGVYFCD